MVGTFYFVMQAPFLFEAVDQAQIVEAITNQINNTKKLYTDCRQSAL